METEPSKAPDHPDLTVVELGGVAKVRTTYWVNGLSSNVRYNVFNSNITTCVKAMKERLLYVKDKDGKFIPTPKPTRSFSEVCSSFKTAFAKLVKPASPLRRDEFLGAYEGRRRTVYAAAFESLKCKPFHLWDSFCSYFVKCEKVNVTKKPDSVPRGISPRTPRYHVMVGVYIKRIEKTVYNIIAKLFGAVTVFKGLNAADRGRQMRDHWDQFVDPVAIGLDASRFDQHVSIQALKFEHSFYKMFFPNDRVLSKLLKMQCNNKLFANCKDGRAKLTLEGVRMSGDMNTALGNCLLMCCMVYTYLKARVTKFRLANDGDDCVVIIERKELSKIKDLSEWFKTLGFDMKIELPVDIFEQIEFCQSQPVWTPQGWLMVRKISDSIPKDSLSLKPLDNRKVFLKWMKAVGEGGLALTGGIPILQDLYQSYNTIAGEVKALTDPTLETGLKMLGKGMKREYALKIHPLTRVSFWRAFGIPISKQLCYERILQEVSFDYPERFEMYSQSRLRL
jgi:hypothetical protein